MWHSMILRVGVQVQTFKRSVIEIYLPTKHLGVFEGFQIELEFGSVGFWGEGKTEVPGETPLGARERTKKPGFEPGPDWWEATVLTTAPPLLPHVMEDFKAEILFCLLCCLSIFAKSISR